jgi:hypothetical protein
VPCRSCRVLSCRVLAWLVLSCLVLSFLDLSCCAVSCLVSPCPFYCLFLSGPVLICLRTVLVLSFDVCLVTLFAVGYHTTWCIRICRQFLFCLAFFIMILSYLALLCLVWPFFVFLPCLALPQLALSCLELPRLVLSFLVLSCHVLSCLMLVTFSYELSFECIKLVLSIVPCDCLGSVPVLSCDRPAP